MPRGRKPAAAKMSAPEKKVSIVLTEEQFGTLRKVSQLIGEARGILDNLEERETVSALAFGVGKAFFGTNQAEDLLDEVIRDIDPDRDDDWSSDSDDEEN